jgi:hypothetical protein
MSISVGQSMRAASTSISATGSPAAKYAPTIAPALVPTTRSGRKPSRSSTRSTPRCANARAAPPESTSATRGLGADAGGASKRGGSTGAASAGAALEVKIVVAQPATSAARPIRRTTPCH